MLEPVFSPQSTLELTNAINECIELSPEDDCSDGPHGPIHEWDVSSITDMRSMFSSAISFNSDISKWNVSNVTDMRSMFSHAISFNADISKWDLSSVTLISQMFEECISFNGDISEWDVSNVEDMFFMFGGAKSFDSDISKWDVLCAEDMTSMFEEATSFNGDISKWHVYNVGSMDNMFLNAVAFKQELCGQAWVLSKASQNNMFAGSYGFISRTVCSPVAKKLDAQFDAAMSPGADLSTSTDIDADNMSHRIKLERELIARKSIGNTSSIMSTIAHTMTCSKCGRFKKSARVSCCAPGGAWYKNCGGVDSRSVDHSWSEGVEACKRKCRAKGM